MFLLLTIMDLFQVPLQIKYNINYQIIEKGFMSIDKGGQYNYLIFFLESPSIHIKNEDSGSHPIYTESVYLKA